jgi:phage replication-related protein YjqB (UPF0714/DUF867 family)
MSTMATGYQTEILELDLPAQESLKNNQERCSADPRQLRSIGRAVGQQVRIVRADRPGYFALYTVAQPNPPGVDDPCRASVVRTGLTGRERLGSTDEMAGMVQADVVDAAPAREGARFFEVAEDAGCRGYCVVIAPHGGDIEKRTDDEAMHFGGALALSRLPVTVWICKGFGDGLAGAFDRWHITSTDLHPASFPKLQRIARRRFQHGIAFHGFARRPGEADVYIGGGASEPLKAELRSALEDAGLPLEIRVATEADDAKFQGRSPDNLINRLAAQGIHLEQSAKARTFDLQIATAVAAVYRCPDRVDFSSQVRIDAGVRFSAT